MPGRRAFLRRRHVTAGASRANRAPPVPTRTSLLFVAGFRVPEWVCCRAASGARAAGGPARRVGLPLATWGPVIAGTGTRRRERRNQPPSRQFPRHFPWSGSECLSTNEVLDVGPFCGVDRLQITCHRRSENPSAVTAKTPKFGLEITAAVCAFSATVLVTQRHAVDRNQLEQPSIQHQLDRSAGGRWPAGQGPCRPASCDGTRTSCRD